MENEILNFNLQQHRKKSFFAAALSALVIALLFAEYLGWPFLASPLQSTLSNNLHRPVLFSVADGAVTSSDKTAKPNTFKLYFIGGLRLELDHLTIAAPAWSKAPHTLLAEQFQLELRYIDLWRAYSGAPLKIKRLQASNLDAHLERLQDGRASWQFTESPSTEPINIPTFDHLQVTNGLLSYQDIPLSIDIEAKLSLTNDVRLVANSSAVKNITVLQGSAVGSYQKLPLKIELKTSATLPTSVGNSTNNQAQTLPIALLLNATIGRAKLAFNGGIADILKFNRFAGHFNLKGPSLAAVGDLFNVTLPTTAEFNSSGNINKKENTWNIQVNNLDIGATHLNGPFTYTARKNNTPALLTGQLGGSKLLLADLGPAFGAVPNSTKANKVLPTKPFDLASLRVMDADVRINLHHVDLNTNLLEPLQPLLGHLQLKSGVLSLKNLDARTAEGKLAGDLSLDGRGSVALWNANLRWRDVKLERWVKQVREKGLPPYVSGKLNGYTTLHGQGISTAEMLATAKGSFRTELLEGNVSHLAIEVAGLDLAQAVGIFLKGDEVLPVQCGVIDLDANKGVFTPRVMVVDTKDSAVWVDGSVSLATEALNLRAVVMPKDFSPLTLRAPLHVNGTFSKPKVSLEKGPIGTKIAA